MSRRPKPWKSLNQTQASTRGGMSRTACSNVATMWRLLSSRPLSRASAMQLRPHAVPLNYMSHAGCFLIACGILERCAR